MKFGREIANGIRRRRPRGGDKWHLDEMVITIAGKKHYLWRARTASCSRPWSRADATRRRPSAWLAQAPEKARPGAAGDGDRQAEVLRGGEKGDHARRRAPPAQGAQQPGRELPPADTTTRTADEAVQVGPPRSALRLDPLANLFHLRRVTASQYRAARSQTFEDWAEIAGARLAA
jgi:putative transposase